MKHKHLIVYILISMMVYSCQKNFPVNQSNRQSNQFIDSALRYLNDGLGTLQHADLNTAAPNLIRYEGQAVALRIFEKNARPDKFILLFKKSGVFTGHWVDMTGLKKTALNKYRGIVSLSDLDNHLIVQYSVKDNMVTGIFEPSKTTNTAVHAGAQTSMSTPDNPQMLDPCIITPDNNASFSYYGGYWLFGMETTYGSCYLLAVDPTAQGGSGPQPTESAMEIVPTFPSPKHPIKDIKEELKCFTIDNKATYTISVNVNQPKPNTRNLVNFGNRHEVGHTYLTLQEQLPDGTSIIRNVGFYPQHDAKPTHPVDQSIFGEDSETSYCVSLTINLSASEFNTIQANMIQQQSLSYDLEGFNCTSSAINSFNSINVSLPQNVRQGLQFQGNNPADLGQDIREVNLQALSNLNGGRSIIRTVKDKNDLLPPSRIGNCK